MQNSLARVLQLRSDQLEDKQANGKTKKAEPIWKGEEIATFLMGDSSRQKPWHPIGNDGMLFWHEIRWRIEMRTGWEWMRIEAEIIAFNTLAAIGLTGVFVVLIEAIWG